MNYEASRIAGITYEQKIDEGVLTLIEKSTLRNFKTDGISSFVGGSYSNTLNGYYYAGYGLYSDGIGAATSLGCNIIRGCGILTNLIYSHGTHDFLLSYLTDKDGNDFSFHYFSQFSQQLGISLKYQLKEIWAGFKFKF